jgi:hypothetical protein
MRLRGSPVALFSHGGEALPTIIPLVEMGRREPVVDSAQTDAPQTEVTAENAELV